MPRTSNFHLSTIAEFAFEGLCQVTLPVLLLAATVCPAAISFVQQNSAVPQTPQSSVSVVYSSAQVAGDTNVVAVGWSDVASSASVADSKGNTYALAVGPTRQASIHSQAIYVAKNVVAAAAGANTVTVTFTAAVPWADVRILSYRGLDIASPVEAVAGAVGTGTTLNSGLVTTANANDLLFGASYLTTRVTAPGAGFTSRLITSPDGDIAEDEIVTAAGKYSATATMTSGSWVMQVVALKAAATQSAAATPTFNPAPGTYTTAQTVHLSDTTAGATIYYTTNGTTPTTSSAVYNNATPIQVTATTTIMAMATAPGFVNSAVASGTYSVGSSTAPIAFVQVAYSVPSTPQSTVTVVYSKAQTASNTNVVAIGWSNSTSTVTSVMDTKGNTYNVAVGPTVQSGVQSQIIYVARNIAAAAAGANTVTVKFSAAVLFPDVRALEYSGLDPVSPVDVTAGASGTSATSSSGSVTTTSSYDLLFSANYVSTSTNTAGNGFVNRAITNPDGDIAEDQIVTATGAYTGTAKLTSSGSWIMQTVALRGIGTGPPTPDPSVVGQWGSITAWPILPVHVTLMPTGKVLAFGHDSTVNTTVATIWDPASNGFTPTSFTSADLFCSGHGLLPDGRVFIAGGHNMADYHGLNNGTIFDPTTLAWSSAPAMSFGRWYPTVTALPDGRMLVTSGAINCDGCNATVPEIYSPTANSWTQLTTASLSLPIYPHMFVLPDGRVLNTGSYELPVAAKALNLSTQAWTTIDPTVLDAGSAVMYVPGKILKTGTSANSDSPYKNSAATAYILDMTAGSPAWRTTNSMRFARTYHNLTSLPDGNVLVTGGEGTTNPFDQSTAVYAAEMWSPTSETFTTMASMQTPRVYHSFALLLPDGRVLVGGSGEYGSGSIDQLNAEIYSPPYLFKGARPTVTSAPSRLTYGSQFAVQTPDATNISSVALLRLGSVTHAFNENQRYIPLTFSPSLGSLNVQAPANGNIAPPGHYMLFLVNSSGVPSVGVIVQFPAP